MKSVLGRKPYQVNQLGIARTFQNIRLFNALTAFENVKIGIESRQRTGPVGAMLRLPRTAARSARATPRRSDCSTSSGSASAPTSSSSLPYGDQRRLEIARALGTTPRLLLLDEPAAGTNPAEKRQLECSSGTSPATGISVLLIEHDMHLVMSVATNVVVLNFGQVIAAGTAKPRSSATRRSSRPTSGTAGDGRTKPKPPKS